MSKGQRRRRIAVQVNRKKPKPEPYRLCHTKGCRNVVGVGDPKIYGEPVICSRCRARNQA